MRRLNPKEEAHLETFRKEQKIIEERERSEVLTEAYRIVSNRYGMQAWSSPEILTVSEVQARIKGMSLTQLANEVSRLSNTIKAFDLAKEKIQTLLESGVWWHKHDTDTKKADVEDAAQREIQKINEALPHLKEVRNLYQTQLNKLDKENEPRTKQLLNDVASVEKSARKTVDKIGKIVLKITSKPRPLKELKLLKQLRDAYAEYLDHKEIWQELKAQFKAVNHNPQLQITTFPDLPHIPRDIQSRLRC